MVQYQEANIPFRNKLFTAYGLGIISLFLLFKFGIPFLSAYSLTLSVTDEIRFFSILSTIFLIAIFPVAWRLRVLGQKVIKAGVYPIPSMKLIFRMQIKEGTEALKLGKSLFRLGLFCQIIIPISIIATWTINESFIANPFSFLSKEIQAKFFIIKD